jgi:phosphate transport system permease protein
VDKNQSLSESLKKPFSKILRAERRGRVLTYVSSWVLILILFSLIMFIASKGISTFLDGEVDFANFFSTTWNPGEYQFGALSFILGSLIVSVGAALVSAPLGIGAAIFMTEIAPNWGRKILQPATEILVGIPSVVYGFIGLSVVVPFIREQIGGLGFGLLTGMIVLAIMILPTIVSVSVDALQAVPKHIREGSIALGATRWQTISRLLLRTSLPGLMTGVVLGIARAFGEALAVQMVIGNAPNVPFHLLEPMSTLTSVITLNMGNTVQGSAYHDVLWSMALILLLITLVFIVLIRWMTKRSDLSS